MNDTNWVNSHCIFLKAIHFYKLSLLKYFFKNVIKTLETRNFLSYISIVSWSLNDDLTKIR